MECVGESGTSPLVSCDVRDVGCNESVRAISVFSVWSEVIVSHVDYVIYCDVIF